VSNVVFFDGQNDSVNCGNGVSLQLANAFTFDVLVNLIKPDGVYWAIFSKYLGGNGYTFLTDNTGRLLCDVNGATYFTLGVTPIKDFNRWYRVSASWVAGAGIKFYVDGALVYTSPIVAGPIVDSGTVLTLGWHVSNWRGRMAHVVIYNRQLTDDEVAYNYAHPNNPIKRGIVLNLSQESIQGAQWLDLSGNANHGTYQNGAVPQRANLVTQR
jgi:hypothetical protein